MESGKDAKNVKGMAEFCRVKDEIDNDLVAPA